MVVIRKLTTKFFCSYTTMLACWERNPSDRPSFSELVGTLGDLLQARVQQVFGLNWYRFYYGLLIILGCINEPFLALRRGKITSH